MKSFLLLLFVSGIALADDAALLRCRSIADATARLGCYDALPVTAAGGSAAGLPVNAGKVPAQTATRVQPVAPAVATQAAPPPAQTQFGLEDRAANKGALDAIESTIPGDFEGWSARSTFKLANGQVWQVSDDSARAHYITNPKVRIRRGALGAFYIEIQGTNNSPRVKRVQ